LVVDADDFSVEPGAGNPPRAGIEFPDQTPGQIRNQRLIDIACLPGFHRQLAALHEEALDANPLGGEHLGDVFAGSLEFLHRLSVIALHFGWNRFLAFSVGCEPA
jgi:hypothetical protein